ncbi:MAG: HlyD family efflux transporter periplasmic adaptor subunit [Candidatus Hydrogenedentota bacterium]
MKIEFSGETQTQQSVRPAQDQIRQARPPRVPMLRILIALLISGAIGYGAFRFYYMQSVHTYGVVSSQTESILAPQAGVVGDMTISRGRSVTEGDSLLTILPILTNDETDARARVLDEIQRTDSSRNQQRETTIQLAEKEVQRILRLNAEEIEKRNSDYELARLETLKLKEFQEQKQKRLTKLEELFKLDAAIQSDIDAAENEVQLARRNYQQAQVVERSAKTRVLPSESELEIAKLRLEAAHSAQVVNTADLERARFELELAKDKQVPMVLTSPFNGLVLGLEVVTGSHVREGETIATIVQTDDVWVDVFIPTRQYALISKGDQAKIFTPGNPDPITGSVSEKLGAVVRPPEILRDDLPRQTTTLYARIELPVGVSLLPGLEVRVVIE